jgi:hypothetical protein
VYYSLEKAALEKNAVYFLGVRKPVKSPPGRESEVRWFCAAAKA